MVITMIRCDTEEEFRILMIHIFFSDKRAKQDSDEVVCLEYEFIQSCLRIDQAAHDKADKECEDIEVDLLKEFNAGNHGFASQKYPVYVEWSARKWGCESCAQEYYFFVYNEEDLSLGQLLFRQAELERKAKEERAIFERYEQLARCC